MIASRLSGIAVCALCLSSLAVAQQPGDGSRIIPTPGTGGGAGAQLGPVGQVTLDPKVRLDALLMRWEAEMKAVQSIHVKSLRRTDKDKTVPEPKVWEGEARYLKPNLAALRLVNVKEPQFYELMVCTGQFLYEYRPQFKKLMINELPARAAGFDNNLLSFLFGMNALDAKRRYELTLSKDISEQNPHWIYLDIAPRYEADKREFMRAQLVLFNSTMLPRRLWFLHVNGNEVTWDLLDVDNKVQLKAMDFRPPDAPKGWDTVRVPLEQSPLNAGGLPRGTPTGSGK